MSKHRIKGGLVPPLEKHRHSHPDNFDIDRQRQNSIISNDEKLHLIVMATQLLEGTRAETVMGVGEIQRVSTSEEPLV